MNISDSDYISEIRVKMTITGRVVVQLQQLSGNIRSFIYDILT